MATLIHQLVRDEAGFVISAELILVATIAVLSMVVGLSELSQAINQELEDVASAFGAVSQTYKYSGLEGHQGRWEGSLFSDQVDECDGQWDIVATWPQGEGDCGY
ncbi:MAG TPA: branched-chain amino acid aminotransferase [Planctomycetaceae bacterium]|nr:branched-chain amino acid aminotransferase [Planctomycetaceae bacterium]